MNLSEWSKDMQVRQRYNSAIISKYETQSKKYAKCTLFGCLGQDTKILMRIFFYHPLQTTA